MSFVKETLPKARDLLLPGMVQFQTTNVETDIQVDFQKDELVFIAYRFSTKKSARKSLTLIQIRDEGFSNIINSIIEDTK